jgi:hypothetical protein
MIALATPPFTPAAQKLWNAIPPVHQEQILDNVYCRHCRGAVRMVDYTGTVDQGDLRLQGRCAACGGLVVHIVETSGR